jgi:hypothetical protein
MGEAWAGSYLDRAKLLVDGTEQDCSMLRKHMMDKELATMIRGVAEARLKVASKMEVPSAVAKAHPHLLLVLEHGERAANAVSEGNLKIGLEHLDDATREAKMFRSLLVELGFPLGRARG